MRLPLVMLLGLTLSTEASAMSCASILALLAGGTPEDAVLAQMAQLGVPAGTAVCLANGGASSTIVAAARRQEAPAVDTGTAPPAATPAAEPSPEEPMAAVRPPARRPSPRPMATPRPVSVASRPAPVALQPIANVMRRVEEPVRSSGFVDPERDPLSTFSADVDTGSYTLTRRTLRDGQLPAHDAVRVEEFVNYLPYEYTRPDPGSPFAVDLEMAPSPWGDTWLVRVGVQSRKVPEDQRKPVHLTFLVDTSGSMQSADKIGLVRHAFKLLTEELQDGDTVSLVAYAGSAGLVLAPTPATDQQTILRALDRLTAGGSTAMGAGIQLAYAQADAAYEPGAVNRVLIASDGDANVGATHHEDLSKLIKGYAKRGITLTTLGFGRGNYRDTTMEQIADDGDGNYFYIDSEDEAERVLVERMTSTLEVVARDVKLQVEFFPGAVESYRLIGYDNRALADNEFRDDKVDAGEVGAGHQVTALYEVVWGGPPGDLGVVRIRHKAPGPDAPSAELAFPMAWEDARWTIEESTAQFRMATASATFAEILRDSEFTRHVSLADVRELAEGAARAEYPEDAELVELISTAQRLQPTPVVRW